MTPIPLTTEIVLELIRAAIKFGPEAAIALAKMFQTGATIDDAIAALQNAEEKTAEHYLEEARTRLAGLAVSAPTFTPLDPTPVP